MRRVIVRRSSVHGKGVFAMRPLAAGECVLEYRGELTSWREAVRRHRREGVAGHTFLFGLSDGRVIDDVPIFTTERRELTSPLRR